MHLQHAASPIVPANELGTKRVTALAWGASGLAIATADRVVHVTDKHGHSREDRFSTKAGTTDGSKNYTVRALAWHPSERKLIVAQSDCMAFVYSLGQKKAIVAKFATSAPISCACWPKHHPTEAIIGCDDGMVKLLNLESRKSAKLHEHPNGSAACCAAESPDGASVAIAFADDSIHRFTLRDAQQPTHRRLSPHHCTPIALAWLGGSSTLACVGTDKLLTVYNTNSTSSNSIRKLDTTPLSDGNAPSALVSSPTGEYAALACGNIVVLVVVPSDGSALSNSGKVQLHASLSVTSLMCSQFGSQLAIGTLRGSVHTVNMYMSTTTTSSGRFEITRLSSSAAIVTNLVHEHQANGDTQQPQHPAQLHLHSKHGEHIEQIRIRNQQFVIAKTSCTLIVADFLLGQSSVTEVPWERSRKDLNDRNERFYFAYEGACIAYKPGEAHVLKLGHDEPIATLRMSRWSSRLMSVRLADESGADGSGRVAYLLDPRTLCVESILSKGSNGSPLVVNHSSPIDFLELNHNATYLLFRNKRKQLHILALESQERFALLTYCTYAQWVPGSDVVVACDGDRLLVWYSISDAGSCKALDCPRNAQPLSIERENGRTYVLVDVSGSHLVRESDVNATKEIELDEALVEFGTAVDRGDLEHAAASLEPFDVTAEKEALWRQLAERALARRDLNLSARCFAALGDVSKARFMQKLASAGTSDSSDVELNAELCLLEKQVGKAEAILLEAGRVGSAIDLRKRLHDMDGAVRVAEARSHPSVAELKKERLDTFLRTGQEDRAADAKLEDEQYDEACALLLRGGLPGKAAALAVKHKRNISQSTIDAISTSLSKYGMLERAGDLHEGLGNYELAKNNFRGACVYNRALSLARSKNPADVVPLEAEYADWLASSGYPGAAATHYVEAGQSEKAARAALEAKNLDVAEGILDQQSADFAKPLYTKAANLAEQSGDYEHAERLHLKANNPHEAVETLVRGGLWEQAHRCANAHLGEVEASKLYKRRAENLESARDLKGAEKAYIAANEVSLAIDMRWRHDDIDGALRLVGAYKKEKLPQARQEAAEKLEAEQKFNEAERYHLAGSGGWRACVQMYRSAERWEDAMRVAKAYGGHDASKQVAFAWATNMSGSDAAALLRRLGLLREAIDNAAESGALEHALDLAFNASEAEDKIQEIRLKRAMHLEDIGSFKEAENDFIKAQRPKEAIDMYVHQRDFSSALRVAQEHEPDAVQEVRIADARACIERKDLSRAETRFIEAQRPELAVDMYKKAKRWEDALRVAEDHSPSRVNEIYRLLQSGGEEALYESGVSSSNEQTREQNEASQTSSKQAETAGKRAESFLSHEKPRQAARELSENGGDFASQGGNGLNLMQKIGRSLLRDNFMSDQEPMSRSEAIEDTLGLLARLLAALQEKHSESPWLQNLSRLNNALVLANTHDKALLKGMNRIARRAATSMLRYVSEAPVDKAFFDAGMHAKQDGLAGEAFVLLNRFLDIADAIDEGESVDEIDNSDFTASEITLDVDIPTSLSVSAEDRERARDYVLAQSMDPSSEQTLAMRTCGRCGTETHYNSLTCHSCNESLSACAITGSPVGIGMEAVQCSACDRYANKEDFNDYVESFGCCATCRNPQTPKY